MTRDLFLAKSKREFKVFNKNIAGFDIETYSKKNKFLCAHIIGDGLDETFHTKEDLVNFMNSKKVQGYRFVATNLQFDFLGCFMEYQDCWEVLERNMHIYYFKWKQFGLSKRSITFVDTVNVLPMSVEQMGNVIGTPKLPHPKCFGRKPRNKEELNELVEYCRNDAYISYKTYKDIIVKGCNEEKLPVKLTAGGTALESIKKFLPCNVNVEPVENHKIQKQAYYGGRTEVFIRGKVPNIYSYDVNSMYPAQMIKELPDPESFKKHKKSNLELINKYEGVSYVEGYMPYSLIPPIPVRYDDKLIFPIGYIKGYHNHHALRYYVSQGFQIDKVGEGIIYTRKKKFFERFVEHNFKKKSEYKANNDPRVAFAKLILNSGYGKFGFNYEEATTLIPIQQAKPDQFLKAKQINYFNNETLVEFVTDNGAPTNYSFPIWASYITDYARINLHKFKRLAGLEKVAYVDTDSIKMIGEAPFKTSKLLGEMDFEYKVSFGYYVRPKCYFDKKIKIKGIRSIRTPEQFFQFLVKPIITEERFIKYRTAVKSKKHHKNGKLKINQIINITKKLDLEDTKRSWGIPFNYKQMQRSLPLYMDEQGKAHNINIKTVSYLKLLNNTQESELELFDNEHGQSTNTSSQQSHTSDVMTTSQHETTTNKT